MKKIIVFLIAVLPSLLFPQEKYLIYFKDKAVAKNGTLSKSSAIYNEVHSSLTKKCIERRKKVMDENNLITYEDVPIKAEYISAIQNLGIKIQNQLNWFNAASAYLSKDQINKINQLNFVDKIEKVKSFIYRNENVFSENTGRSIPPDTLYDSDYGPSYYQDSLSDIPQVHNKGIAGEGVLIGLLDTGFNWETPESLRGTKVIAEHDFVFNDNVTANQANDVTGQDSHGTYVFSLIGGYKPGEIIGPAYKAGFVLAKTEDIRSETHQEEDNYAAALEWMEGLGVDITSSSLGYSTFDPGQTSYTYMDMDGKTTIVTKAADLAFQRGVVVVTAAGNEGNTQWHYITAPADGFNVIAVGAVNNLNQLADFSSRGPTFDGRIKPDVLTQGVHVYGATAHSQNQYFYGNGTSAACPIASGIAGLLLSLNPNLTNVEVRKILLESCDNFNTPDNDRGYGLLSADKAISVYYPSFELVNGNYQLQKKIFAQDKINSSTCKIHYSKNSGDFIVNTLIPAGENTFTYNFTDYNSGDSIIFYFTYSDSSNRYYHDPGAYINFKYTFGSNSVNVVGSESDYYLMNNFPNPFNNSTEINFYSKDFKYAELILYNSLGQKVKTLFNNLARPGINTITWNGTEESGALCASGTYFYVLNINGRILTNKMVFLK